MTFSDRVRHFFHVVSNVRPLVWICLYIALTPVFALIYHWLPDGQFRIPDGAPTDYGSWLYYSLVTITTLGFGDYTPAMGWAQAVTAIEVVCGVTIIGFFLNAVGSMKSEIDITSELEKQKAVHEAQEKEKLLKIIPMLVHNINLFLAYCYAMTTPLSKRDDDHQYDDNFTFNDMADMYKPSGLKIDLGNTPAIEGFLRSATRMSLCLDSMQSKIDMTLWPDIMENSFSFVADFQMFTSTDILAERIDLKIREGKDITPTQAEAKISKEIASYEEGSLENVESKNMMPYVDLYKFIKKNATLAKKMELALTSISASTSVSA